jgi:hypothetical protein
MAGGIGTNALPQISISGLTTAGSSGYSALFDMNDEQRYGSHIKKYSIFESTEDLLVLACTWRRLREHNKASTANMNNMLDNRLLEFITPEDRTEATEIQDYYSKKVMLWKLKGNHLTKYRNDLNELIHSDPKKFREEMIGVAYFLPSFRDYDVGLDEVRCTVRNVEMNRVDKIQHTIKSLTPLKKLVRKTKRTHEFHYWLQDDSNNGVMLAIDAKNPLLSVWNNLFETKDVLLMKGSFFAQSRDDFEYYSVKNYELTNI